MRRLRVLARLVVCVGLSGCGPRSGDAASVTPGGSDSVTHDEAAAPTPQIVAAPQSSPVPGAMNNARLGELIARYGAEVEGQPGFWELSVDQIRMAVITDERAGRMRIVAPIVAVGELEPAVLQVLLMANYHTALDARYAISEDVVYAAYIHPLGVLDDDEFQSALLQVAALVRTFGTTFSSTEMVFGAAAVQETNNGSDGEPSPPRDPRLRVD